MDERCGNCKHIRDLILDRIGWSDDKSETTHCCVAISDKKDGFVVEVSKQDRCEMFEAANNLQQKNHEDK